MTGMIKIVALACPLIGVQHAGTMTIFNAKQVVKFNVYENAGGCGGNCVYYETILNVHTTDKEWASFPVSGKELKEVHRAGKDFQKQMVRCLK